MRVMVIAAAAAVLLTACGPRVSTSDNGETTTVRAGGATITAGARPPANMPSFLKVYPGAQIASAIDTGAAGGMVAFTTPDSPDQVATFYKDLATRAGLATALDASNFSGAGGGSRQLTFTETPPGKRHFSVTITMESGKQQVAIVYGPQS